MAENLTTPPCVALTSQCLPNAEPISARSIARWAEQTGPWIIERLRDHNGSWRLHVFCIPTDEGEVSPSRCRYIEQALDDLLRRKQRRLLRKLNRDPQSPRQPDEWLLQIGLRTPTSGYISSISPDRWNWFRRCVSRFPGGMVDVPADRRAPSRAFAKLAEVESRLARRILPGETCVDLGSSPGSWAYWALNRGARVIAVDRSPLRADLIRHERLTFTRGDAFRYQPQQAAEWLLCDVIAFPVRTIDLLERWLSEGWCRWFCATIKFRGHEDYGKLEPLKAWLAAAGHDFFLRRLTANKNEVMVFGRAAGPGVEPLMGGL
jgi:23S rRNA (cytidine2498-2'-O)-methyltransferase